MEVPREDDPAGRRTIGRLVVALVVAVTGGVVPVAAQPPPTLMAVPAPVVVPESPSPSPAPTVPVPAAPVPAAAEPLVVQPLGLLQDQAVPRGLWGGEGLPSAPDPEPFDEGATGFHRSARPVQVTLAEAYLRAVDRAPASCHLPVSLLAAIGEVESGSLRGRSITADHRVSPPVYGPALNGMGFASIPDTDGGALDSDVVWDRAVGPMQFIPGTWRAYGTDGDGDGRADPQNVFDAAASAASYLCAGGRDLATPEGLRSAILSYNYSEEYLITVLGWKDIYERGGALPTTPTVRALGGSQLVAARSTLPAPPSLASTVTAGPSATATSPGSGATTTAVENEVVPSPSPAQTATPSTEATPTPTPTPTVTPTDPTQTTPTPVPTQTTAAPTPTPVPSQTATSTPTPLPPATVCAPPVSELPSNPSTAPTATSSAQPSASPSDVEVVCP